MSTFSHEDFQNLLIKVTKNIAGKPLDSMLQQQLNESFPPEGPVFKAIEEACHHGIATGDLCRHEAGGIKYGRVVKPTEILEGCSVDVVDMADIAGPHHSHPNGEIDLIMPLDSNAKFDGHGAGWLVYEPGSSHSPTVTCGRALVLYLLPSGAIEFTRSA